MTTGLYETFKVKALLRDPAFYAVLIPVLAPLLPGDVKLYVEANREAFLALYGYLGLHMGIRMVGAHAAGKTAVAVEPVVATELLKTQAAADAESGTPDENLDDLAAAHADAVELAKELGVDAPPLPVELGGDA